MWDGRSSRRPARTSSVTNHRNAAVYGVFAFVLGLVFWISVVTRLVVYTAELDVGLKPPAMAALDGAATPRPCADREVLAAQGRNRSRRRPEQQISVSFDESDSAPRNASSRSV